MAKVQSLTSAIKVVHSALMPAEILFLSYCPLATDLSGCLLTEGDAKKQPDVHPALDLVLDHCLFSAHYHEHDRPVPVCMDVVVAFICFHTQHIVSSAVTRVEGHLLYV